LENKMKNIHVLPTDKPTTLFKDDFGNFIYSINIDQEQNHFEPQHIYITSDEEIKEREICIYGKSLFLVENIFYNSGAFRHLSPKIKIKGKLLPNMKAGEFDSMTPLNKIILTTDQDLIKDGVQAIDDEFLEWFVKNPSCEEVEVKYDKDVFPYGVETSNGYGWYKIIIPQEEPKQETLEEAAENYGNIIGNKDGTTQFDFREGAKWQQEQILQFLYSEITERRPYSSSKMCEKVIEFIEQFKKK